MEFQKPEKDNMDLGFANVAPGNYIWQINEGIDLLRKEDSEGITLMIPLINDQVLNGDGDTAASGSKAVLFFVLITKEGKSNKFGEDQLNNIIYYAGLGEAFAKKFKGKIDPTSQSFVDALKLKLPGTFIQATHDIKPDIKKVDRMNFTNFGTVSKKKAPIPKADSDEGADPSDSNEDW